VLRFPNYARISNDKRASTNSIVNFVRFDVESTDLRAIGVDQDISDLSLEFEEMATSIAFNYKTTARTSKVLDRQPRIQMS